MQASRQASRQASTFSNLKQELTSRVLPLLKDDISPLQSILLSKTLKDFLPDSPVYDDLYLQKSRLPFSHHLVYFPPPTPLSSLLPDGTDPLHSPGDPFNRRMWAGGSINLKNHQNSLRTRSHAHCHERIRDVTIKGREGEEKIYVQIERSISHPQRSESLEGPPEKGSPLPTDEGLIELRNLVFLRDNALKVSADASLTPTKIIRPHNPPDVSHTLIPTPALLFRFSALTFNAHSIHLDKEYCRDQEGHRNLLVHGPLSLTLMAELLRGHLANTSIKNGIKEPHWEHIKTIEYRNLAPLYAEEEMRLCARNSQKGQWELWVEGRDGRLAVRAVAKTLSGIEI